MHVRLFKPNGPDRVAFVSDALASGGDGVMVQVCKGPSTAKLRDPKLLGPMSREVADQIFARELDALRQEGFVRSGLAELLVQLESKKRRKRALAAKRLGWLRERAAVPALLALAAKANEELPVVLDALGELGDPLAVPVARAAAERKLLSRRRSGVEALRKLGDPEGLAAARARALERIPASVHAELFGAEEGASNALAIAAALSALPVKERGLAIDSLYELGTPTAARASLHALLHSDKTELGAPHVWRYAKSVFKRSMLRRDPVVFGALAHAIESAPPGSGTLAVVKSGLDGSSKQLLIFGARTRRYMVRLAWRYLRSLARYRPEHYVDAAANVLVHYTEANAQAPKGLAGAYARCHLLGRILFGGGSRMRFRNDLFFTVKSAAQATPPKGSREEAFPELWDRSPSGYFTLLAGAKLVMIQRWAYEAVTARHAALTHEQPLPVILDLLSAPYPPTVELAVGELERRFDPADPDWQLVRALAHDERAHVRDLGLRWLAQTAPLWTLSPERVELLLPGGDATARAAIAGHITSALGDAEASQREAIARVILAVLRTPEASDGAHDPLAGIARLLAREIAAALSDTELFALLGSPSAGARVAAAAALAAHPDADAIVGAETLALLGSHSQASLREAARALLLRRRAALVRDPSPIFDLLGSEWPDMRAFAAKFVEDAIPVEGMGLEILIGIVDATYPEVQDLGKALIERRIAALPTQELLSKLLEHPHPNMRRFVLDRLVSHLKDGFVALAATEEFFRTVFLDIRPDRALKRDAVAFLERRGLQDPSQAEIALRLLGELVKSKTVFDFDAALGAIARIKLAMFDGDLTESSAPLTVDEGDPRP